MPILTFPLALALSTCFVVGSLVTWALGERRRRMEREELERQMARALQTRYQVYEGLEETVTRLVTKFDAMESEYRQRLAQAAGPRPAPERTARMRSSNPELWDMEREHNRVTSEQLSEIARRSARITELMEQLQALEPAKTKLESELSGLRHRYENAVANSAEFEQAAMQKIDRLQSRIAELEPLGSMLEACRRDLRDAQDAASALAQEFQQRIEAMLPLQGRVEELEGLMGERDRELGEQKLRILELEGELSGAQQALAKTRARCSELEGEAKSTREQLQAAQAQLESTRASHDGVWKELEGVQAQLTQSKQRCDLQTKDLSKVHGELDALRSQAASVEKAVQRHEARAKELEAELAKAKVLAQTAVARGAEELERERAKRLAAEGRAQALEGQRAAREDEQAKAAARIQELAKELEQARHELNLHRVKLAARSSHAVEAWSVLSELKPMLETLEQKLKDPDGAPAALPSRVSENQSTPTSGG